MTGTRLAVVGYGSIARRHAEVFRAQGTTIVASCNRSQVGRERASADGVLETYSDAAEMVEKVRPDGLIVSADALSQFALASQLIPYRVPMLLEKPPGTSVEETHRLAALARHFDTPIMVGLNRRFYDVYRQALIELGGIDRITSVQVEWSEDPQRIGAVHPPEVLSRLVFCNSLHGLDLLLFFGGPPMDLTILGRNLAPGIYRWQMSATGFSERGVLLVFTSTWDAPGAWRLVLDAPGVRVVAAPLEAALVSRASGGSHQLLPAAEDLRYKPGLFGQATAFLEVVRDHAPLQWPACSLEDALPAMALAERLTAACDTS